MQKTDGEISHYCFGAQNHLGKPRDRNTWAKWTRLFFKGSKEIESGVTVEMSEGGGC